MEYPLISEYVEAILSSEDNLKENTTLRPVLDAHGKPVMSSGNFAVVFKMRDESDGKYYALKCFIKNQEGRAESYMKIADELEITNSQYILPLRYLDDELFVDSAHCDCEEFPVVLMDWVEGETLDTFVRRNLHDPYELDMLSYRFNRMAAWLLAQPFAHGDLKPDNILVCNDGTFVLVDYDGMFVPSMKGEKARETGSPDYRHPQRTDSDFNEHIDDFSIAVIALSLKALALNPDLKNTTASGADTLLLTEEDFRDPGKSATLAAIQTLTTNRDLSLLFGAFQIALAKNSLDLLSFRLFTTPKPTLYANNSNTNDYEEENNVSVEEDSNRINESFAIEKSEAYVDTSVSDKDTINMIIDEYGVHYSRDGKRLIYAPTNIKNYSVRVGTEVICDNAFECCGDIENIFIPDSVIAIGNGAFGGNSELRSVNIPSSVCFIGNNPFTFCQNVKLLFEDNGNFIFDNGFVVSLSGRLIFCLNKSEEIKLPTYIKIIGSSAFTSCENVQDVFIPSSVVEIGSFAFECRENLRSVNIPNSVVRIGDNPFVACCKLRLNIETNKNFMFDNGLLIDRNGRLIACLTGREHVIIPKNVKYIGNRAFEHCYSLDSVTMSNQVDIIDEWAFYECGNLKRIVLSDSLTVIKESAFQECRSLREVVIPNSVIEIGDSAFLLCRSLQEVVISNSVIEIGNSAFGFCKSLENLTIGTSVKTIGLSAFAHCESLQSVVIPSSVTSIDLGAFNGCDSLQSVVILNPNVNIGKHAFPLNCKVNMSAK